MNPNYVCTRVAWNTTQPQGTVKEELWLRNP